MNKLEFVQKMLSATDLENVDAIGDTIESEQAGHLVDKVYSSIVSYYPWPHLYTISQLDISPNPNEFRIPTNKFQINWIRYNKKDLDYIDPKDMIILLDSRDTTLSNVDANGCYIDKDPVYWTSYDDAVITVDSYNGNLMSSLCKCQFIRDPGNLVGDDAIPDLPSRFMPVMLAGCLSEAFFTLKGDDTAGSKYNKEFRLGMIDMKKWARRVNIAQTTESGSDYSRSMAFAMPTTIVISS